MDQLLNKVSNKISKTSKQAVKKTQDIAEISRLKLEIDAQEDIMNEKFREIGMVFYESQRKKPRHPYESLFLEIGQAQEKIDEYTEKIMLMKGIRVCPQCGTEVNARAIFCEICGYNIMQWKASQVTKT